MSHLYRPRMQELVVDRWAPSPDPDCPLEVLGVTLPDGSTSEIDRATFEFFFMPVATTTADLSEGVG